MASPAELYGSSFSTGFELAIIADTGEVFLQRRTPTATLFSNFLGLPGCLEQPDDASPEDAVWRRMGEVLDSDGPAFAQLLGQWDMPPFTPHRVSARVIEVRLDHRPDARDGAWYEPEPLLAAWRAGLVLLEPPVLSLLRYLTEGALFELDPDLIELRPRLWMIPLHTPTLPPATHTNCYLIGDEALTAIDPASPWPDEQARLEAALTRLEARGKRLSAVLLTHHHFDHIAGAMPLRDRYGVPILAHPDTEPLVAPAIPLQDTLPDMSRHALDVGALTALHTPGHAEGHLCYLDAATGTLIAGDMVAGWGTIAVAPPEGDMRLYLDSLERLKALRPSLLLPAHGPPIGGAVEKLDEYLMHRRMREAQVLSALEAGPATIEALVERIYVGLPAGLAWAAAGSLQAHVNKLLEENAVKGDGGWYRRAD